MRFQRRPADPFCGTFVHGLSKAEERCLLRDIKIAQFGTLEKRGLSEHPRSPSRGPR